MGGVSPDLSGKRQIREFLAAKSVIAAQAAREISAAKALKTKEKQPETTVRARSSTNNTRESLQSLRIDYQSENVRLTQCLAAATTVQTLPLSSCECFQKQVRMVRVVPWGKNKLNRLK